MESRSRGVLDTPLEPVIGLAEGETRWRGMTPELEQLTPHTNRHGRSSFRANSRAKAFASKANRLQMPRQTSIFLGQT
jgi:hypothetical protein